MKIKKLETDSSRRPLFLENTRFFEMKIKKSETDSRRKLFFRDHYVFTTLSQIYLGRSHLCKWLLLANLGRRKKGLRNTDLYRYFFPLLSLE